MAQYDNKHFIKFEYLKDVSYAFLSVKRYKCFYHIIITYRINSIIDRFSLVNKIVLNRTKNRK